MVEAETLFPYLKKIQVCSSAFHVTDADRFAPGANGSLSSSMAKRAVLFAYLMIEQIEQLVSTLLVQSINKAAENY